jgi:hypothetical protein
MISQEAVIVENHTSLNPFLPLFSNKSLQLTSGIQITV